MNELDLPPRRPLPAGTRDRALRTVLDGIDGSRRRRTAPLAAAAVVVLVLGAATAVALSPAPAPGELEIPRPATSPTTVAAPTGTPAPVEPDPAAPTAPPPAAGTGYVDPLDRCKAAVTGSGRADQYPDVDGWAASDYLESRGTVDQLLAVDGAFFCFVSPTTVRVSQTAGPAIGGVEVVRIAPQLFGLLNPQGKSVSWGIGTGSSEPLTDPMQAVDLDGGAPAGVNLTVFGADGTGQQYVEPLPESAPDPIVVVTDNPITPRDSSTADGAALDDCVGPTPLNSGYPWLPRGPVGDSEPELWQPVARVDLPGGGYAISATIGEDYAGLCVHTDDTRYWFARMFQSEEPGPTGAVLIGTVAPDGGETPKGGMYGLGADVTRVELTTADGTDVPCEVRSRLALCVGDDPSGPLTLTLFDAAGRSVQQAASLEDI